MHDTLLLVQNHIRMIWRYRWVALIGATVIAMCGWAVVIMLPDRFEVSTKVYLDSRSLLRPLLRGLAVQGTFQQDSTRLISQTLLTRPNLETVARKTDMDLIARTPKDFDNVLQTLGSRINLSKTRTDNIFEITYSNADAKLATRVVEALLNIFVERSLGESRQDTSKSQRFLDEQIREYEARLQAAELRLKEFKQKNLGLMPGSEGGYFGKLEAQLAQRRDAELQLEEARNRRDQLELQLEDVDELFDPGLYDFEESGPTSPLDIRIQNVQLELDEMLLSYTEQHPDVISTRRLMEDLQAKRDAELGVADVLGEDGSVGRDQIENPIYQQVKIALGEADAVVASLEARVSEYQRREEELKKLVDQSLQVEEEFKDLNRVYSIDRRNFEALASRREQLNLSTEAGQSEDIRFRVIEPPREPLVAAWPDRTLFNAGVLGLSVVGGIALAWLVAMLRPSVYTKADFAKFSDYPVLGTVSRLWTPGQLVRRRVEVTSFAAGCLCLLAAYFGVMLLEQLDLDVAAKIGELDLPSRFDALKSKFL